MKRLESQIAAICVSMLLVFTSSSCSDDANDQDAGVANHSNSNSHEATSPKQETTQGGEPIPVGDLRSQHITYEFAIYFLSTPTSGPLKQLDQLLAQDFPEFSRADEADKPKQPTVVANVNSNVQSEYTPPDLESLKYFGRGLSADQAKALQSSKSALILDFAYPIEHQWTGMRSALELVHNLGVQTGGLIWDEETREIFTTEKWKEQRLDEWTETVPDIMSHTVIHAYRKGEHVRAITLGMAKFGLPDILAEKFSWSLNRNVGHVINLFGQTIAEGSRVKESGRFDLDFRTVKNPKVREPQVSSLKENATGVALLTLKKGTWEDGDPNNRLIELGFDRGKGPDIHAKQEQILSEAFGWEDSISHIKHNDAIKAASQRAKQKLPALRAEFTNGLAPGELILVKAPFATPDGKNEWMWVEITKWQGDKITGILNNQPFNIPTLSAGQVVEVSQMKVFDYIRKRPDGSTEGNETGKLIQQQSK